MVRKEKAMWERERIKRERERQKEGKKERRGERMKERKKERESKKERRKERENKRKKIPAIYRMRRFRVFYLLLVAFVLRVRWFRFLHFSRLGWFQAYGGFEKSNSMIPYE